MPRDSDRRDDGLVSTYSSRQPCEETLECHDNGTVPTVNLIPCGVTDDFCVRSSREHFQNFHWKENRVFTAQ